ALARCGEHVSVPQDHISSLHGEGNSPADPSPLVEAVVGVAVAFGGANRPIYVWVVYNKICVSSWFKFPLSIETEYFCRPLAHRAHNERWIQTTDIHCLVVC